ncbi:MAG: (Fe-S)-binding protein [Candidatus Geothermincolia bacterium]
MTDAYYSRARCTRCGTCLQRCPVVRAGAVSSSEFVRMLASGQRVGVVLDRCTGCMSCNAFCPNGANPYGLLLEHYQARYLEKGIPRMFCGAMPQREGPNLWRSLEKWLSPRERANLASWALPPASEEILFLGCNQRLTPYIADSAMFKGLSIFSDPLECCGEYYLRLGLIEEARRKASSLSARFEQLGIKRVVAFCPACQNTMMNLAPEILGVRFNVEVMGLVDWIASSIREGSLSPGGSLRGTVTVQDPCHASGTGEATIAGVREILRSTGLTVTEMETCGLEAGCCGLGASLARYRLTDVIRTGVRRSRQARRTGASMTCAWCNGCYMVMNMFRLVYPFQPPVYHLVELLQIATGEQPLRQVPARSVQLLASALEASARDGFRLGRTHI